MVIVAIGKNRDCGFGFRGMQRVCSLVGCQAMSCGRGPKDRFRVEVIGAVGRLKLHSTASESIQRFAYSPLQNRSVKILVCFDEGRLIYESIVLVVILAQWQTTI